jgi:hypothetical protein
LADSFQILFVTIKDFVPLQLRRELFPTIVKHRPLSASALLLLRTLNDFWPTDLKQQLFAYLRGLSTGQSHPDLFETLGCYLPDDKVQRDSLLDAQVATILKDDGNARDFALSLIEKLLIRADLVTLTKTFDAVLTASTKISGDSARFLRVLTTLIKEFGSRFTTNLFILLVQTIEKNLLTHSDAVFSFFGGVLSDIGTENQRSLLSWLSKKSELSNSGFLLIGEIIDALSKGTVDLALPELDGLWALFFKNGDDRLAELLVAIYADSGSRDCCTRFFDKCLPGIRSVPVLLLIRRFIDRIEGSLGLEQCHLEMNRYVLSDDFITIAFSGDVTEVISLLSDSTYDRVLASAARLQQRRPRDVTLRLAGTKLTAKDWRPRHGMTIQVKCKSSPSQWIASGLVAPRPTLRVSRYANALLELLVLEDAKIRLAALDVLNSIAPLSRTARLTELPVPDWAAFFMQPPFLLLYDIHSLGNLISSGRPEWLSLFCETGGARRFLTFAFEQARRVYPRDSFLPVLKMADLLLLKCRGAPSFSSVLSIGQLISLIREQDDQELLKPYCTLLAEVATNELAQNPAVIPIAKRMFFSSISSVRAIAPQMLEKLDIAQQQRILLSLLPDAFVPTCTDFFEFCLRVVSKIDRPVPIWQALTQFLSQRFAAPVGAPFERLTAVIPPSQAFVGFFALLQAVRNAAVEIPSPEATFWFIVDNIVINDVK